MITSLMLLLMTGAQASTFIGNGGGAGDVELAVSLSQIAETFNFVLRNADSDEIFCQCTSLYSGRPICEPLRNLTDNQRLSCRRVLRDKASEIARIANEPGRIRYQWTHVPIEVSERDGPRAVDAVANPERGEITINQTRFLQMTPTERVFLLTHELLHFTKVNEKPLIDEGPMGPFMGKDGGRQLINAVAASAAVLKEEYPHEIKRHRAKLHRSKSWKPIWLDLNFGESRSSDAPSGSLAFKSHKRVQTGARYQWTNWGLGIAFSSQREDKKILGGIDVDERIEIISAVISYRHFFFSDPLTFWGQSHLLGEVSADYVTAKYHMFDGFLTYDEQVKTYGGSVSLKYNIPTFWGFWHYVGASVEWHPYKYTGINLKYEEPKTTTFIGVSYAF